MMELQTLFRYINQVGQKFKFYYLKMKQILSICLLFTITLSLSLRLGKVNSDNLAGFSHLRKTQNYLHNMQTIANKYLQSHQEGAPTGDELKMFKIMMKFMIENPDIQKAQSEKQPLTPEQNDKVLKLFLNNPVMFGMMVKNLEKTDQLMKGLSEMGKRRYVRIMLTTMSENGINILGGPSSPEQQQKLTNQLMKKFIEDNEIAKQFIKNIDWNGLVNDPEAVKQLQEVPEFKNFDFSKLNDFQKVQIFRYIFKHPELAPKPTSV